MSRFTFRHLIRAMATLVFLTLAHSALAQTKSYTVRAPDGVVLAVQEGGKPDGPAIVFVHGLLGGNLDWEAQFNSAALQRYRLISYDRRGHGLSGKPVAASDYSDGRRWADDLAAVIAASGARKPVVVGWSLGAADISNYLAAYSDVNIAGAVYVGAVIESTPELIAPHPRLYRDINATDLRTHLDTVREFIGLCFQTRPDDAIFQRLLANSAMASWDMQRNFESIDVGGLRSMRKPLLLLYGEKDALVRAGPSAARALVLNPAGQVKMYAASGHAPFIEESTRFNRDLADFVDQATAH